MEPSNQYILLGAAGLITVHLLLVSLINIFQRIPRNRLLGIASLLYSVILINQYVQLPFENYPFIQRLYSLPFILFLPPLFYLYIQSLGELDFSKSILKHLALPVTISLVGIGSYWASAPNLRSLFNVLSLGAFCISALCYFYLGLRYYKRHKSPLILEKYRVRFLVFSVGANIYLMTIILYFVSLLISLLINTVFGELVVFQEAHYITFQWVFNLCSLLFGVWLFIYGLTETPMLRRFILSENIKVADTIIELGPYIQKKLEEELIVKELFRKQDLRLFELADKMGMSKELLSQYLDFQMKTTFKDFVNDLRLKEFKRISLDPQNQKYDLVSLAKSCGFNSKATFYRVFKERYGTSPSQYLNKRL